MPTQKYLERKKEEQDADLRGKIEQIRVDFSRTGYRMLLHHLKRKGIKIGETRLRRVIEKFNLQFTPKKRFVKTTDSNHEFDVYPNLIEELMVDDINQVWTANLTYIRIENGFIYLAVIIDLFSRKIIGWQISKKIDRFLALDALKMAIDQRSPPRGTIHHSDRGSQYLCDDYTELLTENGFHISCSAKGNPYDNAWTESFMKTLKYDEIYMYEYKTYFDVVEKLPRFIEEVHNKKRLHSSLNYLPPEEFENKFANKNESEYQTQVSRPSFRL